MSGADGAEGDAGRGEEAPGGEVERIVAVVLATLAAREGGAARPSRLRAGLDALKAYLPVLVLASSALALVVAAVVYGASPLYYVKRLAVQDAELDAQRRLAEHDRELAGRLAELGRRLLAQGRFADAQNAFAEARELAPSDVAVSLGLRKAEVFRRSAAGDYDPAVVGLRLRTLFAGVAGDDGDCAADAICDPVALAVLGDHLRETGRVEAAREHYHAALARDPEVVIAHAGLGELAFARADPEAAAAHYERALARAPDAPLVRGALAAALVRAERLDEALPHFEAAVALDPDQLATRADYARALRRSGRLDDAYGLVRAVLSHLDDDALWNELSNRALWELSIDGTPHYLQSRSEKIAYFHLSASLAAAFGGRIELARTHVASVPAEHRELRAIIAEVNFLKRLYPRQASRLDSFRRLLTAEASSHAAREVER